MADCCRTIINLFYSLTSHHHASCSGDSMGMNLSDGAKVAE